MSRQPASAGLNGWKGHPIANESREVVEAHSRAYLFAALGVACFGVAIGQLVNLSPTLTVALGLLLGIIAAVAFRFAKPPRTAAKRMLFVGFALAVIGIVARAL